MRPTINPYFFLLILILTLNVIIPFSGVKATPDSKYNVAIRTLNPDGEPVADLNVTVYDPQGEAISSEKTNETGWALFSLEAGNYTFKALWHNVTVGSLSGDVSGNATFTLLCQLVKAYVKVVNLNGEPLSGVRVEVYNWSEPEVLLEVEETNRSGLTGGISLPNGTRYLFITFMENFEVANLSLHLNSSGTVLLEARVANLNVTVTDENGEPLPNIDLRLRERYVDRYGSTILKEDSFKTNGTGNAEFHNLPVDAEYELEALREDVSFAEVEIANLTELLTDGWVHVEVLCPHFTLQVQVLDSEGNTVSNVSVCLYEARSGLLKGSEVTNSSGWVSFHTLPGKYEVEAHSYSTVLRREIIISRSFVNLTGEFTSLVLRGRGFNITLSILVVDSLGQPMPNIRIDVRSDGLLVKSLTTNVDGTASIHGLVEGEYRISVYVSGRLGEAVSVRMHGSREMRVRLEGYVMVAGHPVGVAQLTGLLSVALITAFSVLVLVYKKVTSTRRVEKSL